MEEKKSKRYKVWYNIPLVIRAIILGFAISTIGVFTWSALATVIPMPWSFTIMIGLLWIFWKYFSGSWWPKSTKEFRKTNFRSTKMSTKSWALGLLAALLIVVIEQSGLIVTFRIMEFPAERFSSEYRFLESVPLWAAWMVIIMISGVAGICEEIGFRGYMQVPIEKKYGPLGAITIVSTVFVLVHLHQAWSGPILIQIFFISVLFGSLAYYSRSLIPGIVAHIVMDVFNFSFWWTKIGWQFDKETISNTGIDLHFIIWILTFIISITLFVLFLNKLKLSSRND